MQRFDLHRHVPRSIVRVDVVALCQLPRSTGSQGCLKRPPIESLSMFFESGTARRLQQHRRDFRIELAPWVQLYSRETPRFQDAAEHQAKRPGAVAGRKKPCELTPASSGGKNACGQYCRRDSPRFQDAAEHRAKRPGAVAGRKNPASLLPRAQVARMLAANIA